MKRIVLFLAVFIPGILIGQASLNMTLQSSWDEPGLPSFGSFKYNDIWGYTDCEGREYAILGSLRYIHFFDITDPAEPVEVYRHDTGSNSIWRDFKTYRDYAYAVAEQGSPGLLVFDLSQLPDTVLLARQLTDRFTSAHNIYIDEAAGRLYTAGSNGLSGGTQIYNLKQNPGNPVFLANVPLPLGYIHDIHVRNNIGYCSHGQNGLAIYDFSNPNQLRQLGSLTSYPQQGYNHSSWLSEDGNQLVMADETFGTSLKLLDVSDPGNVEVLSLFRSALLAPTHTNSIAHNPFIRGQYAVVSYYDDGVQVFDMANPDSIKQVAYYDTYPQGQSYSADGCWGVYPFFPSGNIIASDITNGLFILSADSIDWAPIPLPEKPEAMLPDTAFTYCGEVPPAISTSSEGAHYTWYLNGEVLPNSNSQIIDIQEGGFYQVEVSNGICSSLSNEWEVILGQPAIPDFQLDVPSPLCAGADTIFLQIPEGSGQTYILSSPGGSIDTIQGLTALTESGAYGLEVTTADCELLLQPLVEASYLEPQPPAVTVEEDLLTASMAGFYQWYLDGEPISGANGQSYEVQEPGTYSVGIRDANGCIAFSEDIPVSTLNSSRALEWLSLRVFPNPVGDWLQVRSPVPLQAVQLYSAEGGLLWYFAPTGKLEVRVETRHLPAGVYILRLTGPGSRHQELIIKL